MFRSVVFGLSLAVVFDVCGYKPSGKGKSLPAHIKTLAIPVFQNSALNYRVEQRFTHAVIDELLKRARALHVTANPDVADAVLLGDIKRFRVAGVLIDQQGRTRVYNVQIVVSVIVRDLKTKKIVFQNSRMSFEGEYDLSDDPQSFFNEENPAVERIANDFAKTIISTIMEGL